MTDETTADALGLDTPRAFPERRSPDDVRADEDTLNHELSTVVDRHNGDLDHATLVRALIDFADTYAEVYDIDRHVEFRDPPPDGDRDTQVAMVVVPDADDSLAPINWDPREADNGE